jgi:TolB-like protein/DNA-binding winged helix-turn-helix (wHTH) protein
MPDGAEQAVRNRSEPLRIGEWLVEPALNQLSAAGKTSKLEPKAMAVLCYLANRPGQVVTREALLSAIWPGVIVGDDSLTQAVIKLRKALGDVAESPAYIQTIPKGGYRLVATVSTSNEAARAPEPIPIEPRKHHWARRRWMALPGALAIVVIAAATWWTVEGESLPAADAALERESARQATQPTVSVQPFEAVGGDPQATVLARGVTADLVTDLLRVHGLSVIAARPMSSPAAERALSSTTPARYIVTGSVQRFDNRLRLHVHLTDAESGQQLWSERYDRKLSDLFAVQEELGRNILQMLPA